MTQQGADALPEAPPGAVPPGLAAASVRGSGWLLLSVAATFVLQLASAAVLGRLLAPRDFGLVATAGLLLRIVYYFSQFGLGSAVVQKPELTTADLRTGYALAVALGAVATAGSFLLAPVAAALLNQRDAVPVTQALSVSFLLVGLGTTPSALLRRQHRFRAVAVVETLSYVVGYLLVGVGTLVLLDWGVWSLVAAALTQALFQAAAASLLARPPVGLRWHWATARPLVRFGGQVSVVGFLEFWSLQVDTVGVAHARPAESLGQYNRASVLVSPVIQASLVATRVLLSSFARLDGGRRLARAYQDASVPLATGCLVAAAILAGGHDAFVLGLLGPQWTEAAGVLPWLAGATALLSLSQLPATLCESRAVLRPKVVIQLVVLGVLVLAVGLAARSDAPLWVYAACWLLAESGRLALYVAVMAGRFGVPVRDQLGNYAEAALVAAGTLLAVAASQSIVDRLGMSPALCAGTAMLVGLLAALGMVAGRPRGRLRAVLRRRRVLDLVTRTGRSRRVLDRLLG